jgi:hypothetical protein
MRCRAVLVQSAHFPVQALCKVLAVSRSGFYAWRHRQHQPTARALHEQGLRQALTRLHTASRRTYGSPRLW